MDPLESSRLSRTDAVAPPVNRFMVRWFTWYARRYLRQHFNGLRLSSNGWQPRELDRPLVLFSNHASWWDALIGVGVVDHFFPQRRCFAPIDAAAGSPAVLAIEAFKIAGDPKAYPEHFADGLAPWQPKRIVGRSGGGRGGRGGAVGGAGAAAPAAGTVRFESPSTDAGTGEDLGNVAVGHQQPIADNESASAIGRNRDREW